MSPTWIALPEAGSLRSTIDRIMAAAARLIIAGFFRRHETPGVRPVNGERPVLVVANHSNGFVDPVAVTAALGRLPRFLAKATLGNVAPVRWLLSLGGVVLVPRRKDQPDGPHPTSRPSGRAPLPWQP